MTKIKKIICTIAITFSLGVFFSFSMISNAKNIDILTKNTIFDIINNVEDVIITCISVDGKKNLDDNNKLDATLLYIIKHKSDFDNLDLSAEKITIGKINQKEFENELKNIFTNFRHNILEYKYYDNGFVDLVYEPCDYFTYDSKKLLYATKKDNYYEIIAGERRWRAAMKAGLKEIPVIVKEYSNKEAVEISLIENIQREDLNPIEEALAYERLVEEFEMTQEQVAERVSKSRSAVTNSMRLLKLEGDVREMVISGDITEGHARTLLSLPTAEAQKLIADRIVKEKLSVRDTEKLVKKLVSDVKRPVKKRDYEKEAILGNLSEQLKDIFGTKVSISENSRHRGKIEIEYYSDDELNRIFELLQSLR